jgi:hypothetical protein
MDLMRSWAVAVIVYLAGSVLSALSAVVAGTPDLLKGSGRAAVWAAGSALLIYLLMGMFGSLAHPAPQRNDAGRHILAALGVPAVTIAGGAVWGIVHGLAPAGTAASAFAAAAGALIGWALISRLRARGARAGAGIY